MQRFLIDRTARYLVLASASLSIIILIAIIVFICIRGFPALSKIGIIDFLTGTVWRPQQEAYGILPMIVGSFYVTALCMLMAVPLGIACAILLAEIAPTWLREILRPAVELLVGIPSVVYGLVGMVLLVPLIRQIGGYGFSILAAGIVLTAMVLPTIISISEDSIRSVPASYRNASLSLGATQWQTIWHVVLPAARSGLTAGIILGMGRAIGETMAMIMVIGNSVRIPVSPLDAGRTLTGNIAVEIGYASGTHESALFATGIVLLVIILILNSIAFITLRRGERSRHAA